MPFKHGLTGSPEALFELFSTPMYLPHGSSLGRMGPRPPRNGGNITRLVGYDTKHQPVYRQEAGPDGQRFKAWRRSYPANQLARFGYDETVNKTTLVHFRSPEMRRRMRNARKLERQLSRLT